MAVGGGWVVHVDELDALIVIDGDLEGIPGVVCFESDQDELAVRRTNDGRQLAFENLLVRFVVDRGRLVEVVRQNLHLELQMPRYNVSYGDSK
jgi:hypothetical protein